MCLALYEFYLRCLVCNILSSMGSLNKSIDKGDSTTKLVKNLARCLEAAHSLNTRTDVILDTFVAKSLTIASVGANENSA